MSQADRFVALTRKVNSTLHQLISILMREIIVTFEIPSSIFPLPTQFPLQSTFNHPPCSGSGPTFIVLVIVISQQLLRIDLLEWRR